MKKTRLLVLLILCFMSSTKGFSQIWFNKYIDGYWGKVKDYDISAVGNRYREITFFKKYSHPSNYLFKLTINNIPSKIDRKELRRRRNINEWFEYTGSLEYFTCDYEKNPKYQNQKILNSEKNQNFKKDIFTNWPSTTEKGDYVISHKTPVRVTIAPYKKYPIRYNIYFKDDLGFEFYLP